MFIYIFNTILNVYFLSETIWNYVVDMKILMLA
jgi:hypothetical protein